jgi:hypothetical protein
MAGSDSDDDDGPPPLVYQGSDIVVDAFSEFGDNWEKPTPFDTWAAESVFRLLPYHAEHFLGKCKEPIGLTSALDMNILSTFIRLSANHIVRDALLPSVIRSDRKCMDLAAHFQEMSCSGSTMTTLSHRSYVAPTPSAHATAPISRSQAACPSRNGPTCTSRPSGPPTAVRYILPPAAPAPTQHCSPSSARAFRAPQRHSHPGLG